MSREQINEIELQISNLRLELIRIIAEINFIIGSDRKAIFGLEYKRLKSDYSSYKDKITYLQSFRQNYKTGQAFR